jgi:hypothetical protein
MVYLQSVCPSRLSVCCVDPAREEIFIHRWYCYSLRQPNIYLQLKNNRPSQSIYSYLNYYRLKYAALRPNVIVVHSPRAFQFEASLGQPRCPPCVEGVE